MSVLLPHALDANLGQSERLRNIGNPTTSAPQLAADDVRHGSRAYL